MDKEPEAPVPLQRTGTSTFLGQLHRGAPLWGCKIRDSFLTVISGSPSPLKR